MLKPGSSRYFCPNCIEFTYRMAPQVRSKLLPGNVIASGQENALHLGVSQVVRHDFLGDCGCALHRTGGAETFHALPSRMWYDLLGSLPII